MRDWRGRPTYERPWEADVQGFLRSLRPPAQVGELYAELSRLQGDESPYDTWAPRLEF